VIDQTPVAFFDVHEVCAAAEEIVASFQRDFAGMLDGTKVQTDIASRLASR